MACTSSNRLVGGSYGRAFILAIAITVSPVAIAVRIGLAGMRTHDCHPGFLWRSARTAARPFFKHLNCSVSHPFLDFIPAKTVVSADPKSGNQTVASQSVHRGQANVQMVGYFGNRQEASGRGIVAGLHCSTMSEWRSFMAATSIMPLADVVRARRAPVN